MLHVLDIAGLVCVAILSGSMTFFSVVIAPVVFIELDAPTAGRLIRGIFPWYYLVIVILSLFATIALAAPRPVDAAVMGFIGLAAILSRQLLMPRINRYRDLMLSGTVGAETTFNRLHRLSVWINLVQLIGVLTVLVRLAMD